MVGSVCKFCIRCIFCLFYKPNLPNQTYKTKPAIPNLPNQIRLSLPNLSNQNYWSKQSTPGSVVPLAMFSDNVPNAPSCSSERVAVVPLEGVDGGNKIAGNRQPDKIFGICLTAVCRSCRICTGCFFLLFRPNFSAKKKNVVQSSRIFCTSRISWNRVSDWLPIVFHFSTENWERPLKKHPVHDIRLNLFATRVLAVKE